jgi:hypothetical protein
MMGASVLAKMSKKDSNFIDDPQRCEVCGTTLTLYPKDFAACPHCHRKVCRQCWGPAVWGAKSFAAESCSHVAENDGQSMQAAGEPRKGLNWDWPRILFILVLGVLVAGVLFFLYTLFS